MAARVSSGEIQDERAWRAAAPNRASRREDSERESWLGCAMRKPRAIELAMEFLRALGDETGEWDRFWISSEVDEIAGCWIVHWNPNSPDTPESERIRAAFTVVVHKATETVGALGRPALEGFVLDWKRANGLE